MYNLIFAGKSASLSSVTYDSNMKKETWHLCEADPQWKSAQISSFF